MRKGHGEKRVLKYLLPDLFGALLLGVGVSVFSVQAKFAPGGVSGLAVIANYLFGLPIGLATLIINVPIILFTVRKLRWAFFALSVKSILICAFFLDYVVVHLPVYEGPRLWASVLAGVCCGIGYSLIFNEGSSTGGTDFIIVAVKQWKKELSFGLLAFIIDSIVVVLSVFVFRDLWSFVYGLCYTVVTRAALDLTTKVIERFAGPGGPSAGGP